MTKTEVVSARGTASRPHRIVVSAGPDVGKSFVVDRPMTIGSSEVAEVRLTDPGISRRHLRVGPAAGGVQIEDEDSTNGVWLAGVRLGSALLPVGTEIDVGKATKLRIEIDRFAPAPAPRIASAEPRRFGRFCGSAAILDETYRLCRIAAQSDAPVLIEGESGTGKELLAEAIHEESARAEGPFVVLDCGAIPEGLIESELFGHERGAFTGANARHAGAFEAAAGGTLLIDELGELSASSQTRLLGVLQRGHFKRVGGSETITASARVIAATNRNLEREVEDGRFRLDLFHRIAVCMIRVPPLRERLEDLEPLAQQFAAEAGGELPIDAATRERLERHSWPGNVRELRNYVERAVVFGQRELLRERATPSMAPPGAADAMKAALEAAASGAPYRQARALVLQHFTELYVEAMLARHGGSVSLAAKSAGVARRHLHRLRHK